MEKTLAMEKVREGYKQTSIGVIPEEWNISKLGRLSKIGTGSKDNKDKSDVGIYPFFVRSKNIERINTFSYDGEAILIPGEGKIGEIFHYIIGKFDFHQRVYKVSDFENGISGKYIYYYLQNFFIKETIRNSVKATVDSLRLPTFTEMLIHLPSFHEQQKIAAILSAWDEAISKQKSLVELTKTRNQGLARQLLSGKKRLKGFDGEWNNLKFGEVINRITRRNDIENTNVVTISAKRGFVRQDDFFNKQVASETLTNYYLIKKGEFAYNKSYSGGYPMGAFKRLDNFDYGVVTTLYICFSIKDDFDSDFFKHYFEAGQMTHGLTKIAQEGGRAHGLLNIGLTDFLNLKIRIPNLNEQKEISQLIEKAEKELRLQEQQLALLQNEKKGLMQKLLTGEVRVKLNEIK